MARSVDVLGDRTSRLDEVIHQLFGRNKCPHHTDVDVMGGGGQVGEDVWRCYSVICLMILNIAA